MTSNIKTLKKQIESYFHNTYLVKYPVEIRNMLVHLFNDGKRIRPILFIAFNHIDSIESIDLSDASKDSVEPASSINWIEYAIEIELVHCLSLVIDDLPDMDNELERRGKTCFHITFGLQKTEFFLYYLFSKLSSNLTNLLKFHNRNNYITPNTILYDASFIIHYLINNLIDGQYIDITSSRIMKSDLQKVIDSNINMVVQLILSIYNTTINDEKELPSSEIDNYIILNIKKTGTLFALPIITGFLFQIYKKNLEYTGKEIMEDEFYLATNTEKDDDNKVTSLNKLNLGDYNILNLIMTWSMILGFLFQTSDDLLDMIPDSKNGKPNICNILGTENSIKLLYKCMVIMREMFEYIYKNTQRIWPSIILDIESINHIFDLIESRYQLTS